MQYTCSTCVEHSFLGPSVHGAGFFAHWHCFGLISFVILPVFEFERLTITYYTVNIESWPGSSSICCFCSIFVLCLLIFSRGGSISYRCGKIWRKCSLIFGKEFNIILTPAKRWLECQSSSREGTNIILMQDSWVVSSNYLAFHSLTFDPSNLSQFYGMGNLALP